MTTAISQIPEDIPMVYSNWVRTKGNLLDLSVDFGYSEEPFLGPPEMGPSVRVVLSWEHAKGLIGLLQENVKAYEDNVGRVRTFQGEADENDDQATSTD